jgi:adenosine deaminase
VAAKLSKRHYDADAALTEFVAALPKTETHLHLEGSISFEQLHDFDPRRYAEPPEFWDPEFRYENFGHFQRVFDEWILPYHHSAEQYHETAKSVFAECRAQGCRYVETSFHLPAVSWLEADGPDLLDAIHDAVPEGLEVRVFGGMTHIDYREHAELLDQALSWERLAGIDLHGPEDWPVDAEIPGFWQRARRHGKVTKAHAGEFMPASFVDWVIDNLDVDRIQHGTRAVESSRLVEKIAERGIVLDMCPISNLKLQVDGVPEMSEHPIRQLMDAGVCVTVSTDDTFLFGNSLCDEYHALALELGFDRDDILQVARNGIQSSAMDDKAKSDLLRELDDIASKNGAGYNFPRIRDGREA